MSKEEYYLRSILRQLRDVHRDVTNHSLGSEVLADNIDWLDCFIFEKFGQEVTNEAS
jgi:hypothetical protein